MIAVEDPDQYYSYYDSEEYGEYNAVGEGYCTVNGHVATFVTEGDYIIQFDISGTPKITIIIC